MVERKPIPAVLRVGAQVRLWGQGWWWTVIEQDDSSGVFCFLRRGRGVESRWFKHSDVIDTK